RMSLHRSAAAVRDRDVPDGTELRDTQYGRARRQRRLLNRDLHAQTLGISCPVTREGVRARGFSRVRFTAVEHTRGLEYEPRGKLRAVPRASPLGIVLWRERAKNVRLADVAPPELQNSVAADRQRGD